MHKGFYYSKYSGCLAIYSTHTLSGHLFLSKMNTEMFGHCPKVHGI